MTENKTSKANRSKRHLTQKGLPIGKFSTLASLLLLSACESNSLTPSSETVNQTSNDSTAQTQNNSAQSGPANVAANQIDTITEFPTHIKELSLLLHPLRPITDVDANDDSGLLSSYKDRKSSYQVTLEEISKLEYNAHLSNIMFEQTDTGIMQKLLPHNNFIIHDVFVPHIVTYKMAQSNPLEDGNTINEADIINQEMLLENQINISNTSTANLFKKVTTTTFDNIIYQVSETPYDKEGKDRNLLHQQALYMSDTSGKQLNKLHPDNEYLSNTKWMPSVSRYYFMTQSDSDNNGIIDEKDVYHNYVIDFKQDNPTAKKYDFSE